MDRPRHHGPRRRFLRRGERARETGVEDLVEALQECDRFQVLVAALAVRNPFAGLAAVVEVEHRGHRIDAQPVHVIALGPEERAVDQEFRHLRAGRSCRSAYSSPCAGPGGDRRARRGACRRTRARPWASFGKWPGTQSRMTPIPDWWQASTKCGEILRRAEAAGGRELPGRLIAPGAAEGMLHDRQQLDVGEPEIADIGHQRLRQLPIGQEPVALLHPAPPGRRDAPRRSSSA